MKPQLLQKSHSTNAQQELAQEFPATTNLAQDIDGSNGLEATEAAAAWAASALEEMGMEDVEMEEVAVDVAFDGGHDSLDEEEENEKGKEDEEDDGPVSSRIRHITVCSMP